MWKGYFHGFRVFVFLMFSYGLVILSTAVASCVDNNVDSKIGDVYAMKVMTLVYCCVMGGIVIMTMLPVFHAKELYGDLFYIYMCTISSIFMVVSVWVFDSKNPGSSRPMISLNNYQEMNRFLLWKFCNQVIVYFMFATTMIYLGLASKPIFFYHFLTTKDTLTDEAFIELTPKPRSRKSDKN